jgi:hypothetical protein
MDQVEIRTYVQRFDDVGWSSCMATLPVVRDHWSVAEVVAFMASARLLGRMSTQCSLT